jgi:hypothetical protein
MDRRALTSIFIINILLLFLAMSGCGSDSCSTESSGGLVIISYFTMSGTDIAHQGNGDYYITFSVSRTDNQSSDVTVEFSGGSQGETWAAASIAGNTSGLLPGSRYTVTWSSVDDLPDERAQDVRIKINIIGGDSHTTDPFTVDNRGSSPVLVEIVSPEDGSAFHTGDLISFEGSVVNPDQTETFQWTSDLDGLLGSGESIETASLSEGTHHITLSVLRSGEVLDSAAIEITLFSESVNLAPNTIILSGPPEFFEGNHYVVFTWEGQDPDGSIQGYKYKLEGSINTGGWIETSATQNDPICINESGDYFFYVAAIDDQGMEDSTPAEFIFITNSCSA